MAMRKVSTGAIIAIVVIGLVLTATSAGLLSVSQSVSSTGTVTAVNVGVYSDVSCTQTLTSIDWGSVSPGGSVTRMIYVKNTGNAQISLSMTTTNWNPSGANGPITLTWNRESTTLNPGQSTAATLTLSVSSGISGITTFSVNVVITGSG
jgi:archaellum component FlaG (FlaF/FlaG flagellin family)